MTFTANVSSANLLEDYLKESDQGIQQQPNLIAYPFQWQLPAATEMAAYEIILPEVGNLDFTYVAFPWATLIDMLQKNSSQKWSLVRKLGLLRKSSEAQGLGRRVTVAQHIRADRYTILFKACGITDLFWSHATVGRDEIEGIKIHPFPLFPAQTHNGKEPLDQECPRRYLANFIGAYMPGLYLTDVRGHIFRDANKTDDMLIIQRDAWHFERAVYVEQMNGQLANEGQLRREREEAKEYLDSIRQSWFTLCPTGSGPNSIRIFEALALGSIPIVLTKSLRLPGPRALWEKAALFEEDSESGYRRAIARARSMSSVEMQHMIIAGAELFAYVKPESYARLIAGTYRSFEEIL